MASNATESEYILALKAIEVQIENARSGLDRIGWELRRRDLIAEETKSKIFESGPESIKHVFITYSNHNLENFVDKISHSLIDRGYKISSGNLQLRDPQQNGVCSDLRESLFCIGVVTGNDTNVSNNETAMLFDEMKDAANLSKILVLISDSEEKLNSLQHGEYAGSPMPIMTVLSGKSLLNHKASLDDIGKLANSIEALYDKYVERLFSGYGSDRMLLPLPGQSAG